MAEFRRGVQQVFITPEIAAKMKPSIKRRLTRTHRAAERQAAAYVLEELSLVRNDVTYSPPGGKQAFFRPAVLRLYNEELRKIRKEEAEG